LHDALPRKLPEGMDLVVLIIPLKHLLKTKINDY